MTNMNNFQKFQIDNNIASQVEGGFFNLSGFLNAAIDFYQAEIAPLIVLEPTPTPTPEVDNALVKKESNIVVASDDMRGQAANEKASALCKLNV